MLAFDTGTVAMQWGRGDFDSGIRRKRGGKQRLLQLLKGDCRSKAKWRDVGDWMGTI